MQIFLRDRVSFLILIPDRNFSKSGISFGNKIPAKSPGSRGNRRNIGNAGSPPKEWADSREGFYEKHIPCRRDGIERLPAAKKNRRKGRTPPQIFPTETP